MLGGTVGSQFSSFDNCLDVNIDQPRDIVSKIDVRSLMLLAVIQRQHANIPGTGSARTSVTTPAIWSKLEKRITSGLKLLG